LRHASRRPWPKREEATIKARPSPAYARRKAALTDRHLLLSLDLVEEAIAVDPFHRLHRREVGGVVYNITEPGVVVAFEVDGDKVVFRAFVDLRHPLD
jgi:hypothetical protein